MTLRPGLAASLPARAIIHWGRTGATVSSRLREALVVSTSIRRATYDDAMEIAEVHVESWRSTYGGIIDQAFIDNLSGAERAVSWSRRLAMSSATASDVLVATTADGSIVGFLSGGLIRAPYLEFDGSYTRSICWRPFSARVWDVVSHASGQRSRSRAG